MAFRQVDDLHGAPHGSVAASIAGDRPRGRGTRHSSAGSGRGFRRRDTHASPHELRKTST